MTYATFTPRSTPAQKYAMVELVADRAGVCTTVACECLIQSEWNHARATVLARSLSHMTVRTALSILDGGDDDENGEEE